jgi:hypothetical protein
MNKNISFIIYKKLDQKYCLKPNDVIACVLQFANIPLHMEKSIGWKELTHDGGWVINPGWPARANCFCWPELSSKCARFATVKGLIGRCMSRGQFLKHTWYASSETITYMYSSKTLLRKQKQNYIDTQLIKLGNVVHGNCIDMLLCYKLVLISGFVRNIYNSNLYFVSKCWI